MKTWSQFPYKDVIAAAALKDKKFHQSNNRSGTVEAAVSAAKHSKYQATRLSLQSTPDQRDSAGRIGNSNFSVWRITVRLALTPICSPTKTLCKSCTLPMG